MRGQEGQNSHDALASNGAIAVEPQEGQKLRPWWQAGSETLLLSARSFQRGKQGESSEPGGVILAASKDTKARAAANQQGSLSTVFAICRLATRYTSRTMLC